MATLLTLVFLPALYAAWFRPPSAPNTAQLNAGDCTERKAIPALVSPSLFESYRSK